MRAAITKFNIISSLPSTSIAYGLLHSRQAAASISAQLANVLLNNISAISRSPLGARFYSQSIRLAEVGKLETRQPDENYYQPGQPFLHRVFGYRGVTLFPWLARVEDNDLRRQDYDEADNTNSQRSDESQAPDRHQQQNRFYPPPHVVDKREQSGEEHAIPIRSFNTQRDVGQITRFHPYYQVLIDARDWPYVSSRTQTEAVTFLVHPDNSKSMSSIKGLDYVAHEDILPYTSCEPAPINHELHNKLFRTDDETARFIPSNLLESWRNKHPWLDLSRVYRKTTENVRVTVIPFYIGRTLTEGVPYHWWRYCVRLENFGDMSVHLRERHWKIFSQTSMIQTIKGRGVVGIEPKLSSDEPAYQYSSHVTLKDKSGLMWGTYKMQREDGYTFECKIPSFSLESSLESSSTSPTTPLAPRTSSK